MAVKGAMHVEYKFKAQFFDFFLAINLKNIFLEILFILLQIYALLWSIK